MSWAAIGAAAVTTVGGAINARQQKGGGGGGVSAETQGGGGGLEYMPVGLETLEIPDFDYAFLDQIYQDEEEEQQMRYGGPLYAAGGMPIDSGGIVDIFEQMAAQQQQFETDLSEPHVFDPNTQASAPESTTPYLSSEEEASNLKTQNRQDMFKQIGLDFANNELPDLLAKIVKQQNTSPNVRGRGNVVPGAAAGGFRSKPNKLAIEAIGINPFEYKAMKGGGKVLDRGMFAQNYMPNGGALRGPGGPKDDLIPVMASNGEYMLSKAAVDQAGGGNHSKGIAKLEAFNNLGNRRYG